MKQRYKALPIMIVSMVLLWVCFTPSTVADTLLTLFWIIPGSMFLAATFCYFELIWWVKKFPLHRHGTIWVCSRVTKITQCNSVYVVGEETKYRQVTLLRINKCITDLMAMTDINHDLATQFVLWSFYGTAPLSFDKESEILLNKYWMQIKVIEHYWNRRCR